MINNYLVLLFLVVYFGFQIFAQMWGTYLEKGIPSTQNYIQNFVSALVLIGLVIYLGHPNIPINKSTLIVVTIMFIFNFLYCFTRKALDNQTKRDEENNVNAGKKVLRVIIACIYSIMIFFYILFYMSNLGISNLMNVLIYFGILVGLLVSFYVFKNKTQYENKFPYSLFIYPILFLTTGVGTVPSLTLLYTALFTSTVALWGFFGVEWFVGPKKEFQGSINREMCKAYLGIADSDLISPPNQQTQTAVNTKNINYLYIAITLIFVAFLVATVFAYVSVKRILNNQ